MTGKPIHHHHENPRIASILDRIPRNYPLDTETRHSWLRALVRIVPTYREAVSLAMRYGLVADRDEYEEIIEEVMS